MSKIDLRVVAIVCDVLQIELAPDVEDLLRRDCEAWDSVNHLRLVMEIEEAFGIELDDEETVALSSLRQVQALIAARAAPAEIGEAAG